MAKKLSMMKSVLGLRKTRPSIEGTTATTTTTNNSTTTATPMGEEPPGEPSSSSSSSDAAADDNNSSSGSTANGGVDAGGWATTEHASNVAPPDGVDHVGDDIIDRTFRRSNVARVLTASSRGGAVEDVEAAPEDYLLGEEEEGRGEEGGVDASRRSAGSRGRRNHPLSSSITSTATLRSANRNLQVPSKTSGGGLSSSSKFFELRRPSTAAAAKTTTTTTSAHPPGGPDDDVDDGVPPAPPPQTTPPPASSVGIGGPTAAASSRPDLDGPEVDLSYERLVPTLETISLPRGGVSVETSAVGYVQFGIPPETIKDSMRLGIPVPSVYVVPVDRFCRDMGPALGVNLAEFEFPSYFNYFVRGKRCTLIVDSVDAERNIRRVFGETLLGPAQFRVGDSPLTHEEEDFAPDFPREAIPNFQKELLHFRMMPDGRELVLETLLEFRHFESSPDGRFRDWLGVPPPLSANDDAGGGGGGDGDSASDGGGNDDGGDYEEEGDDAEGGVAEIVNRRGSVTDTLSESGGRANKSLNYSQIRWIGDVAKIYPSDAKEQDIQQNKTKRVEIFKMPSGTDYVLHDVDENNIIVGKARFAGNVRVSEGIGVIGLDDDKKAEMGGGGEEADGMSPPRRARPFSKSDRSMSSLLTGMPPTFNPPSFGLTVLGNSHGFDKSGSTSGYVLWINGRGVMIDPPPYSSATLEREGIRPRTIVGIILTHCHADHDAGAFQKVLTGSPVVVITTPTIYKSFIRKYAALSSLKPAILRQSHRFKPAIIGEPLRFQGATFHFTYTLHSIPCVGFKVDWRGRSMVFTGDHFNNPPALQILVEKGVLSKARCADLNHLPLQETDLLLHESGAPPIHTPLDVLLKLPTAVKRRLYVVHTSALPEGCELRVAPTGTAGTIRLDQIRRSDSIKSRPSISESSNGGPHRREPRPSIFESTNTNSFLKYGRNSFTEQLLGDVNEYAESELLDPSPNAYDHLLGEETPRSLRRSSTEPPPVSLRPTSSSDAWFILNLLSAVPFLSDLSYSATMEVLETARVVAFCCNEIVLQASRRRNYLVVVWEGTCMESESMNSNVSLVEGKCKAVWYAGDWTGPRILQPEKRLSGDSSSGHTHDIVAMSAEGVKVIMVNFSNLHTILRQGSALYRKYNLSLSEHHSCVIPSTISQNTAAIFMNAVKTLNIMDLLDCNTALRKLTAVQKRHLECLVEGPVVYTPGQRLWRSGSTVEKAFIVVAGTVSFVPKRMHGGSVATNRVKSQLRLKQAHETKSGTPQEDLGTDLGKAIKPDPVHAIREILAPTQNMTNTEDDVSHGESESNGANESLVSAVSASSLRDSLCETDDYHRLSRGLQKWAERHESNVTEPLRRRDSSSTTVSLEISLHDLCDLTNEGEKEKQQTGDEKQRKWVTVEAVSPNVDFDSSMTNLADSSKDRFANRVLGRLYNRRAFASGLVFSRGHFLGDIEKMVDGLLSSAQSVGDPGRDDSEEFDCGFNNNDDARSLDAMTIHELEGSEYTAHTSTLAAGKDGCVVLVFPKVSLILFLDQHPGLLLSLLGTQVVV